MLKISPDLKSIFIKDFNFSLFIGMALLSFYHRLIEDIIVYDAGGLYQNYYIPLLNGFFTAVVILMLNRFFSGKKYAAIYYTTDKFKLMLIAFLAGCGAFYLSFSVWATWFVTLTVIYAAYYTVKNFINKLYNLLTPLRLATLRDVGLFFNFYITLIISFTTINLSVNALCQKLGYGVAFNFREGIEGIINAVYFSVITMTTVGYGDIIPLTPLSRIIVCFECISCYLTLAVMIGIITRGISFHSNR